MKHALLMVLASVMGAACSDNPTAQTRPEIGGTRPAIPAPSTAAMSGRVLVSGIGADRVVELRDDHGDVIRLLGHETIALANVGGGNVVVWGTWDATPGFVVSHFTVTGMHGRPALEGVIVQRAGRCVLRLADGTSRRVPDATPDCAAYLGARVWMVGLEDATDVQIGIIDNVPPR